MLMVLSFKRIEWLSKRLSLTGRKNQLFFPPVLWDECLSEFKITDLNKRLLHGGLLWEHLVHDMLKVQFGQVFYRTDKNKNEIDFVIKGTGRSVHAFECKINPMKFSPKSLDKFREYYPEGKNFCMAPFIKTPYKLRYNKLEVKFISSVRNLNL